MRQVRARSQRARHIYFIETKRKAQGPFNKPVAQGRPVRSENGSTDIAKYDERLGA
jgi:hypothetical protein